MTDEAYDGAPVVPLTADERSTLADHLREEIAMQADELVHDAPLPLLVKNTSRVAAAVAMLEEITQHGRVTLTVQALEVLHRLAASCRACVTDSARDLHAALHEPWQWGSTDDAEQAADALRASIDRDLDAVLVVGGVLTRGEA